MVHCLGDLSGRKRRSDVPCRKRSPEKWSYRTSTTSFGFIGCHSADLAVDQRLGPPGALPVKPGGAISFSTLAVKTGLSPFGMFEVKPTWLSLPSLSYSPRSSEPTRRLPSL